MTSIHKASASCDGCGGSALFAVVALAPATASAQEPCWEALVADWSDGAISNLYPIGCYRQALKNMPEDVRLYSSASDDINRALAGRGWKRSIAGSAPTAGSSHPTRGGRGRQGPPARRSSSRSRLPPCSSLGGSGGYLARRGNGEAPHASAGRTS